MTRTSTKTSKTTRSTATRSTAAKTTRKPAAKSTLPKTRKSSAAATPAADAPEAVVVQESVPVSDLGELKKVELIEMIVERTGVKKRDAKPTIEAALQILGEALAEGRELNLQPLGKIRVNRMKKLSSARVMTCKVRQTIKEETTEPEPLAEAAE
ncbi:integration host factor subunit alpha [Thalassovita autumnalis]|uniref:Integration host factor subunit alpha n=1 Tax=Thalassovita autumnalis TaxID=2072972 RepID=A0A0P1FMX3_9RHOB|nr:HU family DNA-binding protein [Thalassovita autumnalis]CUH69596.1 integration host factor subunit alpha [Thalassovita autumnalis]CUH72999.1 integration host factor subunit alpha [Thalassovita autumnalis]